MGKCGAFRYFGKIDNQEVINTKVGKQNFDRKWENAGPAEKTGKNMETTNKTRIYNTGNVGELPHAACSGSSARQAGKFGSRPLAQDSQNGQ